MASVRKMKKSELIKLVYCLRAEINKVERDYAHLYDKVQHGCTDAFCDECDGKRGLKNE